jgi:hypothetical protein
VSKRALEKISARERKRYGITCNPARDVARLKPKNPGGHHTWSIEEIERYEERHPIGGPKGERLCLTAVS